MTTNNDILKEIQKLEQEGDLPSRVTNRLVLAGIIKNTGDISTLVAKESKNEKRIGTLEKLVTFLSTLVLALLGWTIYAG